MRGDMADLLCQEIVRDLRVLVVVDHRSNNGSQHQHVVVLACGLR